MCPLNLHTAGQRGSQHDMLHRSEQQVRILKVFKLSHLTTRVPRHIQRRECRPKASRDGSQGFPLSAASFGDSLHVSAAPSGGPDRKHLNQQSTLDAVENLDHERNNGAHAPGERPQAAQETQSFPSNGQGKFDLPAHWNQHLDRVRNTVKKRHIERCMLRVAEINRLEPGLRELTDEDLRNKTEEFKLRLTAGKDTLDSLLPQAFAVVREAARRYINMRHFDTQLIGGMVLHEGKIAEMGTGEGKTLVATLAAYLNALTGKGVHVVTVNNYLAARDANWMGSVFQALGLTVGVCLDHALGPKNQAALNCDITYITAQNLAWIYLADNSSITDVAELTIQRPFHYAIVDEADSVLIDDANNALIISRNDPAHNASQWKLAAKVCPQSLWARKVKISGGSQRGLEWGSRQKEGFEGYALWDTHEYPRDRNGRALGPPQILLNSATKELEITELGHQKIFDTLVNMGYTPPVLEGQKAEPGDLWNGANSIGPLVYSVLKAQTYQKDVEYILRDNKIIILSQNTGRAMEKSRWNEGMHQAVEVKEGLEPGVSDIPFARITYQLFFNFYSKLSGMTGTARAADKELNVQYRLAVDTIPPHKPCIRIDHPIEIFIDASRETWSASWPEWYKSRFQFSARKDERVADLVIQSVFKNQPVLLGTSSVEESEDLEEMLRRIGIVTEVLNARPEAARKEAAIIAQAGLPQTSHRVHGRVIPAVTISTSMAGRGTDIRLGGDPQGIMRTAISCLLLPYMTNDPSSLDTQVCPLSFWPADNSLAGLRRHLPPALHDVLRSASSAVMTFCFQPQRKIPAEQAKILLQDSFTKAESCVNAFLLEMKKEHGGILKLSESDLLKRLEDFSCTLLPVYSLKSDSYKGVQSRIDKAAVFMWVWLEAYCSTLASEARAAGGLRVICTSLGPSWRILDQFRGRSGRQGDPGESFVILNLNQDILRNSPVRTKQSKKIESHLGSSTWNSSTNEFTKEPMDYGWATQLATGPYMRAQESRARDHRVSTKETDEVLSLIRDQVYAFRRWIISADSQQLHAMLRAFCYDAAADLILDTINVGNKPGGLQPWDLENVLIGTWKLVNGEKASDKELSSEENRASKVDVRVWVPELLGVVMTEDAELNPELKALAGRLRSCLADRGSLCELAPQLLATEPHLDLHFIMEQMDASEKAFLNGADKRFQELKLRYKREALELIKLLALALYWAWLGPRRAALKRQMGLELVLSGIKPYDSMLGQNPPAGGSRWIDTEVMLQDWERRCLAASLQDLWTDLLLYSDLADQAASFTFISHLKPIQEYTSSMTEAYIRLLDDHRVLSIQNLFAGPDLRRSSGNLPDADDDDGSDVDDGN